MTFSAVNALVWGHLEKVAWHNKQATKNVLQKKICNPQEKHNIATSVLYVSVFIIYIEGKLHQNPEWPKSQETFVHPTYECQQRI